ncbi:hypothetical protein Tco_1229876 [Tanacetum coccineum]
MVPVFNHHLDTQVNSSSASKDARRNLSQRKRKESIKSRFGRNDESKKMQKYILKQQFEGFSVSNSEGLHKGYDRFQSLLSQLEIHGAVFENDVKGSTASSSSTQNVAFISENIISINDVSTVYGVSNPSALVILMEKVEIGTSARRREDYALMACKTGSGSDTELSWALSRRKKSYGPSLWTNEKVQSCWVMLLWGHLSRNPWWLLHASLVLLSESINLGDYVEWLPPKFELPRQSNVSIKASRRPPLKASSGLIVWHHVWTQDLSRGWAYAFHQDKASSVKITAAGEKVNAAESLLVVSTEVNAN